jgi:hypothetical protein
MVLNDNDKTEDFKPYIIEHNYALMLVCISECPICKKPMVYIGKDHWRLFPSYWKLQAKTQIQRAGWTIESNEKQEGEYVCIECLKAGKITFVCSLCEIRKPTSKIQESIGYPPEHLCIDCYETKTAKEWEEILTKLKAKHTYDFIE